MTAPTATVGDVLRAQAHALGDKIFVVCGDRSYSFAEMDRRSDRVAAGLAELGVASMENVAFVASNRPEMLEMMFGCAKLGAVQVPLNAFLRGEFLRYQLEDSQARTLVVDGSGFRAVEGLAAELTAIERVIVFDHVVSESRFGAKVVPYSQVRESTASVRTADVRPDSLMSILYTSGTTGLPKGCMMPHGYYAHVGRTTADMWGIRPDDVLFTALPLYHAGARLLVTMAALVNGATATVDPEFSVSTVWDRVVESGATTFVGTGMMGTGMLSVTSSERDRTHRLRLAVFLPFSEDAQRRFERRFGSVCWAEFYGQTECVPVTYTSVSADDRRRGTVGQPAPFFEVRVVDDEDNAVAPGEIGEIIVRPRGPHVMFQGYWRKERETLESWRNLWHHTGDFGCMDRDGCLRFVDRKKDALRRRGENISSIELEAAISQHPRIAECAVHAIPSELTEDEIKVCVVTKDEQDVTPDELFTFFKTELPYFAIPRYYEVMSALPRNAVSRVMKHVLREHGLNENTVDLDQLGLRVAKHERR